MPTVTVKPVQKVSVKINQGGPQVVHNTTTFVGGGGSGQGGVVSFNQRQGLVTLDATDVRDALGYTPANKAGDTFTGNVAVPALVVNGAATISSNTYTTVTTAPVTVDSFSTGLYRSAKYEAQITSGAMYHAVEIRVVHNGTQVWMTQYGEVYTDSSLGSFDATISSGVLSLVFTPAFAVSTIKLMRNSTSV